MSMLSDTELKLWMATAVAAATGTANSEYHTRKSAKDAAEIADRIVIEFRERDTNGIETR